MLLILLCIELYGRLCVVNGKSIGKAKMHMRRNDSSELTSIFSVYPLCTAMHGQCVFMVEREMSINSKTFV